MNQTDNRNSVSFASIQAALSVIQDYLNTQENMPAIVKNDFYGATVPAIKLTANGMGEIVQEDVSGQYTASFPFLLLIKADLSGSDALDIIALFTRLTNALCTQTMNTDTFTVQRIQPISPPVCLNETNHTVRYYQCAYNCIIKQHA